MALSHFGLFGGGIVMTLLLGTYSSSSVVLTADGICLRRWQNRELTVIDDYQKIFPLKGHPLAICQHGQNLLSSTGFIDREAYEVLRDVLNAHRDEIPTLSVCDLAGLVRRELEEIALHTINAIHDKKPTIGLWIVGFGRGTVKPQAWEVFWPDRPEPTQMEDIMSGGSGNLLIESRVHMQGGDLRPKSLKTKNVAYMASCHDKIYRAALDAQGPVDPPEIGGHKHRLAISKKKYFWIISPASVPPIEL
jgi:hypothetical protein